MLDFWRNKIREGQSATEKKREIENVDKVMKVWPKMMKTKEDKLVKAMERAAERKDKRALGGWLNAWAREDKKEQKRWEKRMMRD